jgi:K+-transporting ATPase ATPase A chain
VYPYFVAVGFTVAVILSFNGTPMTFNGKDTITTLEGQTQNVSRAFRGGVVAIKQLGTNGGGFYNLIRPARWKTPITSPTS